MGINVISVTSLFMCSGGSKGGGREGRAPPWGPNSFNFMQFLGKYGKIICWRPLGSCRPLFGEILDPPLMWVNLFTDIEFFTCISG